MKKFLPILMAAGLLSGCIMRGELRRCYGVAVPFVKVGVCEVYNR